MGINGGRATSGSASLYVTPRRGFARGAMAFVQSQIDRRYKLITMQTAVIVNTSEVPSSPEQQ